MTVRERIDSDYLREVKAQNAPAVSTLRMLRAALQNAAIDKTDHKLTEEDAIDVIGREVKKLKDPIALFRAGGREDLAAKTEAEIAQMSAYLPEQLTDEDLEKIVRAKIAALGQATIKDFGRVMGDVAKETKGRADGSKVSSLVKTILSG